MKLRHWFWIVVRENHKNKKLIKRAWTKKMVTFNLMSCTTLWGNHCHNDSISVSVNETHINGYFDPHVLSKHSSCIRLQDATFQLLLQMPNGNYIRVHRSPRQNGQRFAFALSHSWVYLAVCFGSIPCWKIHGMWLTLSSTSLLKMLIYNSLEIPRT